MMLLKSAGSSTTTDTELLLSRKALETYFVHLKSSQGYQPTIIAEKLRQMKKDIEFTIHEADNTPEGDALYIRARKLLDTLKGWGHSLGKSIVIQQQQYSGKVVEELRLIEEPGSFLDNKEVSEKLKCTIQQLQSGMNKNHVLFLTAYCAAMILYYNGQR